MWDCFENAVKRYESPGEFLQVSGFKVEYDTTNPAGHRVIKLEGVNDDGEYENIEPETVYWVGMSDFIAGVAAAVAYWLVSGTTSIHLI